jgi:hypothetical protein
MASSPQAADALVCGALESIHPRPSDDASRADKKNFAERLSRVLAQAFAAAFRARGMTECLPKAPDAPGPSGGERRMAGGIGAKKFDIGECPPTLSSIHGRRDPGSREEQLELIAERNADLYEVKDGHIKRT